jgi:FkbM family methyltransferase
VKANLQRLSNLIQWLKPDPLAIRPVWITLDSGYQLKIDSRATLNLFVDIFSTQQYKAAFDFLTNIDWIVDLGANRGLFSIYVYHYIIEHGLASSPQILCIEAAKRNYLALLEHIRVNSFEDNIFPVRGVVTDKREGTAPFYYAAKSHGMSSVVGDNRITTRRHQVIDVAGYLNFPRIDLLKIDIEGSEQAFIQGYPEILDKTNLLIAEFHLRQINYSICKSILESHGLLFRQRVLSIGNHLIIDIFQRFGKQ